MWESCPAGWPLTADNSLWTGTECRAPQEARRSSFLLPVVLREAVLSAGFCVLGRDAFARFTTLVGCIAPTAHEGCVTGLLAFQSLEWSRLLARCRPSPPPSGTRTSGVLRLLGARRSLPSGRISWRWASSPTRLGEPPPSGWRESCGCCLRRSSRHSRPHLETGSLASVFCSRRCSLVREHWLRRLP